MKKILTILFMMALISPAMAVTQWSKAIPQSTDLKSAWPAASQANLSILDSLLSNYQQGLFLTYTSTTTLTVTPGQIVVSNADGSIRLFLVQSTSANITFSNIDTGSSAASTQYYVYAGTSTATDSAPTFYISLSSSAPTGVTYYSQIGSFVTDSASSMTNITNNNSYGSQNGALISRSGGVLYHALTDLTVGCWQNPNAQYQTVTIETGSISGSMTTVQICGMSNQSVNSYCSISWPIRKGDYYEIIDAGSSTNCNALSTGN